MRHIKPYSQLFENTQELTQEQKDWLNACTTGRWKLNPQTGLVDVDGDFDCVGQRLIDFKGVKFGMANNYFFCYSNQLTSLEGAPQQVGSDFDCHDNQLTSLKGAPQEVGASFDCSDNSLTSLKGGPLTVGGSFYCSENSLASLEGAPREIGGDFVCDSNQLTTLKGAPQKVEGDFYCQYNQLTSLEGAPWEVGGSINCFNNPITEWVIEGILREMSNEGITLEQAVERLWNEIPEEDGTYLAKHHPNLPPEEKREYEALERHKKRLI